MLTIDERKSGEGSGRMSFGMRLGPYEIAGFIGAGAMGEVYRAHDTSLNRVVALKMLPIEFASDPELLHRFEEEARTASALSHPAVVTIYEAGQIGSQPYISMELVAGETLREILAFGAMPLRRALGIAGQIAEGLTKAHEAGLVHRDLKPENIKVSVDGFAKILDFGLAKRVSPHVHEPDSVTKLSFVTSPGTVLGTAGYMAPEQASGGPADARSDQFAFGAVVYEMLTGQRAFDRPTIAETLSAIIREEPAPIAQLNPAVPAPVRWIVERCLAKDPAERYALTRDLARDLASAREHLHELLASRRVRPPTRVPGQLALAVLPVTNLSADPGHEAFADAMTEALITELTRIDGLRVISRTSSMAYKGRCNGLPEIAEELGVDLILLATIVVAGRQIRVTAQLVDAAVDENRWANSYTRSMRSALMMQAEVASEIARDVERALAAKKLLAVIEGPIQGHTLRHARTRRVRTQRTRKARHAGA
jgi:serine/threonine protein kinase